MFNNEFNKRNKHKFISNFLATNKQTGEKCLIKIIDEIIYVERKILQNFISEFKLIIHPNIIELKEIIETEEKIYIINKVTSGLLFKRIIEKTSSTYTEKYISTIIRQLIITLDYLHEKNFIHNDIQPENLFFINNKEEIENNQEILLLDISKSSIIQLIQSQKLECRCDLPLFISPERIKSENNTTKGDMWSVGVIVYLLLCGFLPFIHDKDMPKLFDSILNANFNFPVENWKNISNDAIDFINCLLVIDPLKRMSAKEALQHAWLQGIPPQFPLERAKNNLKEYYYSSPDIWFDEDC